MKSYTKIIALLMALLLSLTLTACGASPEDSDASESADSERLPDAELIVGKWEGDLNVAAAMTNIAGLENYITFTMPYGFEFSAEGIMTVYMEKSKVAAAVDDIDSKLTEGLSKFYDENPGLAPGDTKQAFIDMVLAAARATRTSIPEEGVRTEVGSYTIQDGKLTLTIEGIESLYALCEFSDNDHFTITGFYRDGEALDTHGLFPATFERVE